MSANFGQNPPEKELASTPVPLVLTLKTILTLTAVFLWAVSMGAQLTPDEIHSAVTGKWQVANVLCPSCTPHARSEVGATIELSGRAIPCSSSSANLHKPPLI